MFPSLLGAAGGGGLVWDGRAGGSSAPQACSPYCTPSIFFFNTIRKKYKPSYFYAPLPPCALLPAVCRRHWGLPPLCSPGLAQHSTQCQHQQLWAQCCIGICMRANKETSFQTSALICRLRNSKTKRVRKREGGVCSKYAWEDSKTL